MKGSDFRRWIRNLGPLVEYVSSPNIADLGSPKVAEMVTADGVWRWEVFSHVLPPHVLLHIVVISSPLPSFLSASIAWNCEASDSFSIRYAYKLCSGEISGDEDPVWKSVHHFTGMQKIWIFLWLVCNEKIMINGALMSA
ncbi:hypothetical protein V6N13_036444 [Hibiscus sabdariffa]